MKWSKDKVHRFEIFLGEIWENRKYSGVLSDWYKSDGEAVNQVVFRVIHKKEGSYLKARNYVGVVRFEGDSIHSLPKVFRHLSAEQALTESNMHLLWWLTYSQRLRLPKHITGLGYQECDFLQVIIYLFATYTLEQLTQGPYHAYREIENSSSFVRGQLLFNEYISDNLSKGNAEKILCRYERVEVDNQLNRVIKSVCKKLLTLAVLKESQVVIKRILFKLDEVTNIDACQADCDKVVLNRMFRNYKMVLDYCRMFLANAQNSIHSNNIESFAFLVPMEKVFEDFVYGFIRWEMSESMQVISQHNKVKLTNCGKFTLKPDLYVTNLVSQKELIADCKYKLIKEGRIGVSQSDLYQILAYAIRFGVREVRIIYPDWQKLSGSEPLSLKFRDEFTHDTDVGVEIINLGVVRHIPERLNERKSIREVFDDTRNELISQFRSIFK